MSGKEHAPQMASVESSQMVSSVKLPILKKDKTGLGYGDPLSKSNSEVLSSIFDSRSSDGDDNQTNDRFKKDDRYHAVFPPLTRNYMPPLADLSFAGLDDSVYRPTANKTSASISKDSQTTVKPSFKKIEFTNARIESVKSDKQVAKSKMVTQNSEVDRKDWKAEFNPHQQSLPNKHPYLSFHITIAMSTQQDIYAATSESRHPMLNKENYVPWSSHLLRYAKSRPNGKLIYNSILNGPYVGRMIPEPGDANHEVTVTETFYLQIDDELSDKELKQIEADDQAFQTILLGLPEDIYAAVDSCETAQENWLRVQQMMKGSDIGIQEKKAKLFIEWESRHVTIVHQTKDLHTADYTQLYDFLKYNQKEVDELKAGRLTKTQDPLTLMENSNNPYAFPAPHQDNSSLNQNYLRQPMLNPEDITDPTTAMNMALTLMAKAFKLNYSTPTNNNQRISSNPSNRQIAQPGMNMGQDRQMRMVGGNGENQFRQYAGKNAGNPAGYNDVIRNQTGNGNLVAARAEGNATGQNKNQIRCYNCRGVGNYARNCTVMPRRRDAAYLQTQLLIAQKEEEGIQLQAEEYDLMAAAANLDEIEEVNAN
nr:hypothetical protein [Tanacetum cinerariifolium]